MGPTVRVVGGGGGGREAYLEVPYTDGAVLRGGPQAGPVPMTSPAPPPLAWTDRSQTVPVNVTGK